MTALFVAFVVASKRSTMVEGGVALPLPSLPKIATTATPATLGETDGAEIHCPFGVNRPPETSTGAAALTPAYARTAPAAYRYFAKCQVYEEGSSEPAVRT